MGRPAVTRGAGGDHAGEADDDAAGVGVFTEMRTLGVIDAMCHGQLWWRRGESFHCCALCATQGAHELYSLASCRISTPAIRCRFTFPFVLFLCILSRYQYLT